jgi:hypothetical protein
MTRDVHHDEARARWGETEAWRISQERARARTDSEEAAMRAEFDAATAALARAMRSGARPEGAATQAAVEGWRQVTDRYAYPCDAAQLGRLAELYQSDERFRASFDAHEPGLAEFVILAFRHAAAGASAT